MFRVGQTTPCGHGIKLSENMKTAQLGRTGLLVSRIGFGALPIQRTNMAEAVRILQRAYDCGVTFFDTANMYSDSEEKLGRALSGVRTKVVIATKTVATDAQTALQHLETSLRNLKTDYVDIFQLHNPTFLPGATDPLYGALLKAKAKGLVRHLGISNHRASVAREAIASDLFSTIQFPLSHISSPEDLQLIDLCRRNNVGLIAMKALCGGLITNIPAAFSFMRQYENVVPIWGIQRESELDQFIALESHPPLLDADMLAVIEKDRRELGGSFCRGCGYCLPCPVDIQIPLAARMKFLLRRAPYQQFLVEDWKAKMLKIENCTGCRSCVSKCPYGLDTPELLKEMLLDYNAFASAHRES
jgi:predicted aldo/keto reductase-like oxidoreductase